MSQDKLDSMLRKGVVLSIVWLMGIGSLVSVIQAVRAKRIIDESRGALVGMGKVWWCLIVGGMGLAFWGFVLVMVLINNSR
jgi:hypothetical protein